MGMARSVLIKLKAERFYRLLMKSDPADASAPFNLGNMLRANGRYVEAEAAFRTATRTDPTFAQAWYNLADLLDDQGRPDSAIECLRKALRVAPDYADAMFNLALLLQRKNQYPEAADHWRRYLASDCRSEWATRACRSLKFCEMQSHLSASACDPPQFPGRGTSTRTGGQASSGSDSSPMRSLPR